MKWQQANCLVGMVPGTLRLPDQAQKLFTECQLQRAMFMPENVLAVYLHRQSSSRAKECCQACLDLLAESQSQHLSFPHVTNDTTVPQNVATIKLKKIWIASSAWEGGMVHTEYFLPT